MASISNVPMEATRAFEPMPPFWRRFIPGVNGRPQEDTVSLSLLWSIRVGVVLLFFTPLVVTPSTVFPIMFT